MRLVEGTSLDWQATEYLRKGLANWNPENAINVVLHTRKYPQGMKSGDEGANLQKINSIILEQNIKHFYNKVSKKLNKRFREEPVMTLVGSIERGECVGLHVHLLIEPPKSEVIAKEDFVILMDEVWRSTNYGRSINYAVPVKNWVASVIYNTKRKTKEKTVPDSIVHFGSPWWTTD
jgi:hypothetical protein